MSWARFDDAYCDHPKIVCAGVMAELLDIRGILYACRLETDGAIKRELLPLVGRGIARPAAQAKKLVEVGRWTETADGWAIVDFLTYNPSRSDREKERAAARERMARNRNSPRSSPEHPPNVRPNNERSSPYPVPSPPLDNSSPRVEHDAPPDPVENDRFEAVRESRIATRLKGRNGAAGIAYRKTIARDLDIDNDRTRKLLAEFPEAPASTIGAYLDGEPNTLAEYRPREVSA